MTFPNIFLDVEAQKVVDPAMYMDGTSFTVKVDDESVATAAVTNGKIIFTGVKEGQTTVSVTGSRTDSFVITVRKGAEGNGWL